MEPSSRTPDPLLYLERRAKQLQQNVQKYLDAQSEGLLAGLTGGTTEDTSSNDSRTPTPSLTTYTPPRAIPIPVRQPPKQKIGLRGARRGLRTSIQELYRLKEEEDGALASHLREREEALRIVEGFQQKRIGLEKEITGIQSLEENQRIQELNSEARNVASEIEELETRLLELKSKHRYLVGEASQLENSVQSKLSSYNAALSILNSEERRFLKRPPTHSPLNGNANSSFLSLSSDRRTLSMAKKQWQDEHEAIKRRQTGVQLERDALRNGGRVWEEVVDEITAFEKALRQEMHRLSNGSEYAQTTSESRLMGIISKMDQTTEYLEQKLFLADEKDWKLLVVAIGAELEAFKEGRGILQDALNTSLGPVAWAKETAEASQFDGLVVETAPDGSGSLSEPRPTEAGGSMPSLQAEEYDDEPDPDLLISH